MRNFEVDFALKSSIIGKMLNVPICLSTMFSSDGDRYSMISNDRHTHNRDHDAVALENRSTTTTRAYQKHKTQQKTEKENEGGSFFRLGPSALC